MSTLRRLGLLISFRAWWFFRPERGGIVPRWPIGGGVTVAVRIVTIDGGGWDGSSPPEKQ
jgi:hypothetical protein